MTDSDLLFVQRRFQRPAPCFGSLRQYLVYVRVLLLLSVPFSTVKFVVLKSIHSKFPCCFCTTGSYLCIHAYTLYVHTM